MAGLLNRSAVRKYVLEYAGETRHQPFSRVSPEVYDAAEERLRSFLRGVVRCHPSNGKTIRV